MKIQISKTRATLTEPEALTSGMVGKTISLEFSDEWQGLNIIAVFSNGSISKDVVNPQAEVIIPWEVLQEAGEHCEVGFYGYTLVDGVKVLAIPTIYCDLGHISQGADPSGDPSVELSPTVAEQLQADVNDLDERVTYLEEHGGGGGESYDDTELRNRISTIEGKESGWNAKYSKPVGGIPKTDLASDVQTSLGRADTALQSHQSLAGYATEAYVQNYHDNTKQDVISDIASIRSGAALGATAVQPDDLDDYALKSDLKEVGRACYNLLSKSVYTEDVTALMSALWGLVGANLVSISAVFTQGEAVVYPTTSLDSLKSMLVVTAHYDDSTTAEVNDYTLSGTLAEGTSIITATYNDKTATFNVDVTAEPPAPTLDYISAVYTQSGEVYESTELDSLKSDLVVAAHLTDESTQIVDAADYTLSGILAVGTSVVTVSYEDKTTTFNVTVSAQPTGYVLYKTIGKNKLSNGNLVGTYGSVTADGDGNLVHYVSSHNGRVAYGYFDIEFDNFHDYKLEYDTNLEGSNVGIQCFNQSVLDKVEAEEAFSPTYDTGWQSSGYEILNATIVSKSLLRMRFVFKKVPEGNITRDNFSEIRIYRKAVSA